MEEAMAEVKMVVEGVYSAKAARELAEKKRETDRSLLKIENCSYADMQVWKVLFAF